MSAMTPVFLNTEFWLLWSLRQLLRGIAIGIGLTSAMVTLTLFAAAGALASSLEVLQERSRKRVSSRNSTEQATSTHGPKEVLS